MFREPVPETHAGSGTALHGTVTVPELRRQTTGTRSGTADEADDDAGSGSRGIACRCRYRVTTRASQTPPPRRPPRTTPLPTPLRTRPSRRSYVPVPAVPVSSRRHCTAPGTRYSYPVPGIRYPGTVPVQDEAPYLAPAADREVPNSLLSLRITGSVHRMSDATTRPGTSESGEPDVRIDLTARS